MQKYIIKLNNKGKCFDIYPCRIIVEKAVIE